MVGEREADFSIPVTTPHLTYFVLTGILGKINECLSSDCLKVVDSQDAVLC